MSESTEYVTIPHPNDVYAPHAHLIKSMQPRINHIVEAIKRHELPLELEYDNTLYVRFDEQLSQFEIAWLDWYFKEQGWGCLRGNYARRTDDVHVTEVRLSFFDVPERGHTGPMGLPGNSGHVGPPGKLNITAKLLLAALVINSLINSYLLFTQ